MVPYGILNPEQVKILQQIPDTPPSNNITWNFMQNANDKHVK